MRFDYIRQNIFAFWIGIAAIVGSVVYFAIPAALDKSSIGRGSVHGLDYIWNGMYLAAGAFTVYGIWVVSPRSELAGKSLFTAALLVNSITIFSYRGWAGVPQGVILLSLAVACALRASVLIKAYRIDREMRRDLFSS